MNRFSMHWNAWETCMTKEKQNHRRPPDLTAACANFSWNNSSTVSRNTSSNKRKNVVQEKRTITQKLGDKPCEGCTHINTFRVILESKTVSIC